MERGKNKRRQFVVEPDFQFGFIRKLAILSLFISLFSFSLLGLVYHFYGDVLVEIEVCQPMPFGLGAKAMTVAGGSLPASPVCSLFDLLWPVILISAVLTLVLASLFGLFFSHKIAGPVHRMRRDLVSIRQGDFGVEMRARKGDAFLPLISDINQLREHWRALIKELGGIYQALGSENNPEARRQSLARLGEIVSSFRLGPEGPET